MNKERSTLTLNDVISVLQSIHEEYGNVNMVVYHE